MPVPKRRTSKTRKNLRRSHHALQGPAQSDCPSCGERMIPHRVCPKCGHYKDRLVINMNED